MENSRCTVLFQYFPFTQNHTQNCKNRNRNLRGVMVVGEGSTPNELISAEHFTLLLLLSEARMDLVTATTDSTQLKRARTPMQNHAENIKTSSALPRYKRNAIKAARSAGKNCGKHSTPFSIATRPTFQPLLGREVKAAASFLR